MSTLAFLDDEVEEDQVGHGESDRHATQDLNDGKVGVDLVFQDFKFVTLPVQQSNQRLQVRTLEILTRGFNAEYAVEDDSAHVHNGIDNVARVLHGRGSEEEVVVCSKLELN